MNSEMAYDNNAYTVMLMYHDGFKTLTVYTTYLTLFKNPKSSIEYCMTQLNFFAVTDNLNTF